MSCWSATRRVASSRPSALWPTSPGRHQPSWRHRRPVPGAQGLSRDVGPGHAQLPGPSINGRPRHPGPVRGTHTVPPGAAPRLTRRGGGRARRSECDHAERPGAGGRHRRDRRAGLPRHRGPDRPPVRDGSRLGVPDCDRAAHRRPRLRSAVDRQRRSARRRAGTPRGDEASRRYCCGRRRRKAPTCWNIVHDPARPGGKGCRPGAAGGVRSSDRRGRRAPRTSMVRRAGRPDSQTDPRCGWPRDRTRRGSLSWPTSSRPRPVDSRPAR